MSVGSDYYMVSGTHPNRHDFLDGLATCLRFESGDLAILPALSADVVRSGVGSSRACNGDCVNSD